MTRPSEAFVTVWRRLDCCLQCQKQNKKMSRYKQQTCCKKLDSIHVTHNAHTPRTQLESGSSYSTGGESLTPLQRRRFTALSSIHTMQHFYDRANAVLVGNKLTAEPLSPRTSEA